MTRKGQVLGSWLFVGALVALLICSDALAQVTPDSVKAWFDAKGVIAIFVWGLFCKYLPFLARVPNALITWIGAIGYIVAKFAVPEAHAFDGRTIIDAGSVVVSAFTSAVWARQAYEGFARSLLGKLGWKKAVAAAVIGAVSR